MTFSNFVKSKALALCAAGLMAAGFMTAGEAWADRGNRTTVLIVAEDGDYSSEANYGQISRRTVDAVMEQMNQMGFEVYDAESTTQYAVGSARYRMSRGDLIDLARTGVTFPGTGRPITIRAAVTMEVNLAARASAYANKVRVRVTGRIIDVQSGRFVGNYEVLDPAGAINLPASCAGYKCLEEYIGDNSRELGQAVGYELARLLDWDRNGDGEGSSNRYASGGYEETYSLTFKNLNDREMSEVEVYLVDYFSGYRDHDLDRSSGKTHYVTYRSTIKTSKLKRNLVRVLDELGWKGRVTNSGNVFTFEKLALRKRRDDNTDTGW